MNPTQTTTAAERVVLRWFLVFFFALAVAIFVGTWWRKAQACDVSCRAEGFKQGQVGFVGGGRFGVRTDCTCDPATPARQR